MSGQDGCVQLIDQPYTKLRRNPPPDVWTLTSIDENTGLYWATAGSGQPGSAGGPPYPTLAESKAVFASETGDAEMAQTTSSEIHGLDCRDPSSAPIERTTQDPVHQQSTRLWSKLRVRIVAPGAPFESNALSCNSPISADEVPPLDAGLATVRHFGVLTPKRDANLAEEVPRSAAAECIGDVVEGLMALTLS